VNYTELKSKTVKTKKLHQCEWCGQRIALAENCYYRAYIFDGDFINGWMHNECREAMDATDSYDLAEGWIPGDYDRPE